MKWTEDKINILKEGVNNKLTYREISDTLGISANSVRLKAQKLKISSKYIERLKNLTEIVKCGNCQTDFSALISENRKYCSKSCSASFTNIGTNRYLDKPSVNKILSNKCNNCNIPIGSKSKYCSQKCHREDEYIININKWKSGDLSGYSGKTKSISNWLRKYLLEKYNNSCAKCGWDELHPVDHKPLVEINHIDGNAENNSEDNLEVLCPNCHSMTYNFRARNKSSARIRK